MEKTGESYAVKWPPREDLFYRRTRVADNISDLTAYLDVSFNSITLVSPESAVKRDTI